MRAAVDFSEKMGSKGLQEALAKGQAPVLIKLIESIASRFGITVSEKLVAQAAPVVGAVGGAGINLLFINHFQDMAKGHFIVKRLEKRHGKDYIRGLYEDIS
jgi:hypothetical protein